MTALQVTQQEPYDHYDVDIDTARGALAHCLDNSLTEVYAAHRNLDWLVQLYDIELVEGPGKDDIWHALAAAERELRNAARIVTSLPD